MYNEERKTRFITETHSSSEYGRSIFTTTEPYETKEGVDVSEFTANTLQSLINENFGSRIRTAYTVISFLKSYISWCKKEGYKTTDGVYSLEIDVDSKMRQKMVASPAHLESILNKIFEPVTSNTVDCLYRCYLWMAFAGIDEDETVEVLVSEVDLGSMLIEHNGGSYEIYREAVSAFKMACEATEFRYINPNYAEEKQGMYRERYKGEYLLRGIRSPKLKIATLRAVIGKKFREYNIQTSYGRIRLSGIFYKAFEMERFGEPVNFNAYVVERMKKNNHPLEHGISKDKWAYSVKRDIERDYESWKRAFQG